MTQYTERVRLHKLQMDAELWGKKVHYIHAHNGVMEICYNNGNVKYIVNYHYGLKDGYEYWYYENGIKKSESLYQQDEIVVDIIRWDKNGNLIYK